MVSGTPSSNESSATGEVNSANNPPVAGASNADSSSSIRSESIRAANISDQAAENDLLEFKPYVEAMADFLTNEETKRPLTLSIEGAWGSSKSSFMKQLQAEIERIEKLKQGPDPKIVWFNAWRHDKVEELWAAFALEFLRQISTPRNLDEEISIWKGHWRLFRVESDQNFV